MNPSTTTNSHRPPNLTPLQTTPNNNTMNNNNNTINNNNIIASSPPSVGSNFHKTKISDLKPFLNDLNLQVIVLEKRETIKTKDHQYITSFLIADESACIYLSLWNHKADYIQAGDILKIQGAQTQLWQKSQMNLTHSRNAQFTRIGEFNMIFNENRNMSLLEWEENPPNSKRWYAKAPSSSSSATTTTMNTTSGNNNAILTGIQQQNISPPTTVNPLSTTNTNVNKK
ncbi:hypothetical protein ABK040_011251 [Willaertia magna]